MQQLANGQEPELDFGASKDELSNFDNDGQLMSIKDHCAVPPPEPRAPVIEPPSDVEALRRDYDARLRPACLWSDRRDALEELVEAALAASERAVAAYKAEKRAAHRSSSQVVPRATTCAALLASSGRVHVAVKPCARTSMRRYVSAERAVVMRADRKCDGRTLKNYQYQ